MSGIILHGNIAYSESFDHIASCPDSYVVAVDGICRGVYKEIPEEYKDLPVDDHWDKLIIPGTIDLKCDAAAFQLRGLNEARTEKEWEQMISLEEARFRNSTYALRANDMFIDDLYCGTATRAVIHISEGVEETLKLMELLDNAGMITCVATKVRNKEEYHRFTDLIDDLDGLDEDDDFDRTILIPAISEQLTDEETLALMEALQEEGEMTMAIESSKVGGWLLNNTFVLSPRRRLCFDDAGKRPPFAGMQDGDFSFGLCSDTGLYGTTDMLGVCRDTVLESRVREHMVHQEAMTPDRAFYLATVGGGSFFGDVGTFKDGYEFDAVVIDDQNQDTMHEFDPRERLIRMMQIGDERNVVGKYVLGDKLY